MIDTFAQIYKELAIDLQHNALYRVKFACRGLMMGREMPAKLNIGMVSKGASFFSYPSHRVTPIRFTLAELCWILAGRSDVESIASYNKAMLHYVHEGEKFMSGSYGGRLRDQLPILIERLKADIYTRQACAVIFTRLDCVDQTKTHVPCNVFLQFLCRPPFLDLHVTSRSSDFVTGFSIDTIHWQALLILMANELKTHGFEVIPNMVHYSIASLHVYEADCEMVDAWTVSKFQIPSPEHFIPLTITLSQAIDNAKNYFNKDLVLIDLMDMLGINITHLPQLQMLDEMFQKHRNKVVR